MVIHYYTTQQQNFDNLHDDNFIKTAHSRADHFLHKLKADNKNFMQNMPVDPLNEITQAEEMKKFYILRKMDLFVLMKISFAHGLEIDVDIRTSPLLIYLKQRQIRLLIRAVQDLLNHRTDRPKPRPGQVSGSKLWWKYTIRRVIEEE